jgi:hypothetical protein
MKKIRMKIDKKGSEDGVIIKQFENDQTYLIKDSLADVFLKEDWGEEILTPEKLQKVEILIPEKQKKKGKRIKK